MNRLGWGLIVALVLAQWGMFRQFVLREVAWSYPPHHDQANFLQRSYEGYSQILNLGPRKGLGDEIFFHRSREPRLPPWKVELPLRPRGGKNPDLRGAAVGLMLPLQATLAYCLAGPGRMTALSLNFIYFAGFQIALVATLRRFSGKWSVALIGLGLLLCASTPFYFQGGIADFRTDFISFCLFGTFVCMVVRSRVFADRNWSAAAGCVGALLFTFRFVTIVYLPGVLAALAVFLGYRARRFGDGLARKRLMNLGIAAGIIGIVAVPILVQRWPAINDYYVAGHITGGEKEIRAGEQGITTTWSWLSFYPRSLLGDHVGTHMMTWIGVLLLGAAARGFAGPNMRISGINRGTRNPALWVFVMACLFVPLAALMADRAKSPVVADVMVGPLIWITLASAIGIAGIGRTSRRSPLMRWGLSTLAIVLVSDGLRYQADHFATHASASGDRAQIEKLLNLEDRIARAADAMGWKTPNFAVDRISDSINFKVFEVMAFERLGESFDGREVLADSVLARGPDEEINRLHLADFVLLTEQFPEGTLAYPFDRSMRQLHPELYSWCRQNLIEVDHERLGPPFNYDVTVFLRPAVRVNGEPDGWVARTGATITGIAGVLRHRPVIDLWGPNSATSLPRPPHVTAILTVNGNEIRVPAGLAYEGTRYHLQLDLGSMELPLNDRMDIRLTFDSSFTPRQVAGTPDDRQLVMRLPDQGELRLK